MGEVVGSCEHGKEHSGSSKHGASHKQLRISSPLRKDYVPGADYIVIKQNYAAIMLGCSHSRIGYTPHFQVTVCHCNAQKCIEGKRQINIWLAKIWNLK